MRDIIIIVNEGDNYEEEDEGEDWMNDQDPSTGLY